MHKRRRSRHPKAPARSPLLNSFCLHAPRLVRGPATDAMARTRFLHFAYGGYVPIGTCVLSLQSVSLPLCTLLPRPVPILYPPRRGKLPVLE